MQLIHNLKLKFQMKILIRLLNVLIIPFCLVEIKMFNENLSDIDKVLLVLIRTKCNILFINSSKYLSSNYLYF